MAATESSSFSMSIMDNSREKSTLSFHTVQLGAGTFAAHITLRDAFIQAVEDVIDGTIISSKSSLDKNFAGTAPSDENSEREKKILVTMYDGTVNKFYSFTIPCRKPFNDTDWKMILHSDEIDPTSDLAAALITATNNFARSPYGNAGTVTKLTRVGRNL